MHNHDTPVLTEPAGSAPAITTSASARDQWLAQCESDLAEALATGNADLLPVLAASVFLPAAERCQDCRGTGYDTWTLELCYCMAGQCPAYDFLRYGTGDVIALIGTSRRNRDGEADVWVPCQHCDIAPIKLGPYDDGDDLTRVPWVPDCPVCNDTGWMFSHHVNARPRMALPMPIIPASLAAPASHPARSALHG
jgi:hypothetical protein